MAEADKHSERTRSSGVGAKNRFDSTLGLSLDGGDHRFMVMDCGKGSLCVWRLCHDACEFVSAAAAFTAAIASPRPATPSALVHAALALGFVSQPFPSCCCR